MKDLEEFRERKAEITAISRKLGQFKKLLRELEAQQSNIERSLDSAKREYNEDLKELQLDVDGYQDICRTYETVERVYATRYDGKPKLAGGQLSCERRAA